MIMTIMTIAAMYLFLLAVVGIGILWEKVAWAWYVHGWGLRPW